MEDMRYELKYCERCGTLKLRQVASVSTYCRRCEGLLARFTFARGSESANSAAHSVAPALRMLTRIPVVVLSDRLAGRVQ
jgi:ribosomal protein L37AE/L43A